MVDSHEVAGWATDWHAEALRWRLSCPLTRYWVHTVGDVALITTRTRYARMPVTVVLKAFPLASGRTRLSDPEARPVRATPAVRAAVRFHRSAFAVYAGFNRSVRISGIAPPRRLQPSPLNLIVRRLDPAVDHDSFELDTFELLDMDAY